MEQSRYSYTPGEESTIVAYKEQESCRPKNSLGSCLVSGHNSPAEDFIDMDDVDWTQIDGIDLVENSG